MKRLNLRKTASVFVMASMVWAGSYSLSFAAGAWDQSTNYFIGDTVIHNGLTYKALQGTAGVVPGAQGSESIWASEGAGGGQANPDPRIPSYSSSTAYPGSEVVFNLGRYFQAKWWIRDEEPGVPLKNQWGTSAWKEITYDQALTALGLAKPAGGSNAGQANPNPGQPDQNAGQPDQNAGQANPNPGQVDQNAGSTGASQGAGGVPVGAPSYNANDVYISGDIVFHNGAFYKAKWWTRGKSHAGETGPNKAEPGFAAANPWDSPWSALSQAEIEAAGLSVAPSASQTGGAAEPAPAPGSDGVAVVVQRDPIVPVFEPGKIYNSDTVVFHLNHYYKAQALTQAADIPGLTQSWVKIGTEEAVSLAQVQSQEAPVILDLTNPEDGNQEAPELVAELEEITPDPTPQPEAEPAPEEKVVTVGDIPNWKAGAVYAKRGGVVLHQGRYYQNGWWAGGQNTPGSATNADGSPSPWKEVNEQKALDILAGISTAGDAGTSQVAAAAPAKKKYPEYKISRRDLARERDAIIAASPEISSLKKAITNLPDEVVEKITPGNPANPENVRRVESIISKKAFEEDLFKYRNKLYTYQGFLRAFGKWPHACRTYTDGRDSDMICKKVLATMIAHFVQETGEDWTTHPQVDKKPENGARRDFRFGLYHIREINRRDGDGGTRYAECGPSQWQSWRYPCGKSKVDGGHAYYFGRGAKQLSYNYNYGAYGEIAKGDRDYFLEHPEEIEETWHNLASAVFFYVFPQAPKPSMLDVTDGTYKPNAADLAAGRTSSFGTTTMVINGGVECGGSGAAHAAAVNRARYYKGAMAYFGLTIPEGENLDCTNMKFFDGSSSGAASTYWSVDWSRDTTKPDGLSFKCAPVSYNEGFVTYVDQDYEDCLVRNFGVTIVE